MPTTPPPTSLRARTPPTPSHGEYEPYSPRRSTRTTAHSNPYSSFNGQRTSPSAHLQRTPPATIKRARFARANTQLSSPPSSPASPVRPQHKTPRKRHSPTHTRKTPPGANSDSDGAGPSNHLAPPALDPTGMLPTPSKTPQKRHPTAFAAARVLNFQPAHPNDIMPSPRQQRKNKPQRGSRAQSAFALYEDDAEASSAGEIAIYKDASARVPEVDESEDNPFNNVRREAARPQQRSRRAPRRSQEEEERIDEAVRRDEGVTYVFRGKKIFRPFTDAATHDDPNNAIADNQEQVRLRRQAGVSAQRPLTRSAIRPRLLFPSEGHVRNHHEVRNGDEIAEEDVTDIEMDAHDVPTDAEAQVETTHQLEEELDQATPVNDTFEQIHSPPPTIIKPSRAKKGGKKRAAPGSPTKAQSVPLPDLDAEHDADMRDASFSTSTSIAATAPVASKAKTHSPFDSWARTKAGRKRVGESAAEEEGGGKRAKGPSTIVSAEAAI